jgi:hypothetical protein
MWGFDSLRLPTLHSPVARRGRLPARVGLQKRMAPAIPSAATTQTRPEEESIPAEHAAPPFADGIADHLDKETERQVSLNSNTTTAEATSYASDDHPRISNNSSSGSICSSFSSISSISSSGDDDDNDSDTENVCFFRRTHSHTMEHEEELSSRSHLGKEPPMNHFPRDRTTATEDNGTYQTRIDPDSNRPWHSQLTDHNERYDWSGRETTEAHGNPDGEGNHMVHLQGTARNGDVATSQARQLVVYKHEPSSVSIQHYNSPTNNRSSASRERSMSASHSIAPFQPLDPEEERRRRNEVDRAMEMLEHMRQANLVMEFGPGVDFATCVFCLRDERQWTLTAGVPLAKATAKQRKKHFGPKRRQRKQCLICHTPVCRQHWDSGFLHQQGVILCQDCALLFDLDHLVKCMNLTNQQNAMVPSRAEDMIGTANMVMELQTAQQEQHMRQLLILYDRALLALRHSSQSFDDHARRRIVQTHWHKEGLGIGSHVTNIASGVTGIAATVVFMTPMGPWLLLTSLALGGIATAVWSGSFLVDKLCPQTRQAKQTIALASMVDSLLEATTILRQARNTGFLPTPGATLDDESESTSEEDDVVEQEERPRPPPSTATTASALIIPLDATMAMYFQQDKDQRLMVTIIKAKIDAESRPTNPLHAVLKKVINHKVNQGRQRKQHHQRYESRDRLNDDIAECEQEPEQGPLQRAAHRIREQMSRAKKQAGEAVVVARTANALATVGMSAGKGPSGRFWMKNRGTVKNPVSSTHKDDQSNDAGGAVPDETKSEKGSPQTPLFVDDEAAARQGLQLFARGFFKAAAANERGELRGKEVTGDAEGTSLVVHQPSHEAEFNSVHERSLVPETRHKSMDLKLRASDQTIQALALTNVRAATQEVQGDRRQRVLTTASDPDAPSEADKVFIKNARFVIKATLTVLRETARYAGGAFSAGIVCLETMELNEKVQSIRSGARCSNAEKLEQLRHHLWENQGSFPDTKTLEWELTSTNRAPCVTNGSSPNLCVSTELTTTKVKIVEKPCHGEGKSSVIPHWSSSYEGERPDGSSANLPIMEDSTSSRFGSNGFTSPYQVY